MEITAQYEIDTCISKLIIRNTRQNATVQMGVIVFIRTPYLVSILFI